jgi:hypothetical protein
MMAGPPQSLLWRVHEAAEIFPPGAVYGPFTRWKIPGTAKKIRAGSVACPFKMKLLVI